MADRESLTREQRDRICVEMCEFAGAGNPHHRRLVADVENAAFTALTSPTFRAFVASIAPLPTPAASAGDASECGHPWHACLTGDCPHDTQEQCYAAIGEEMARLEHIVECETAKQAARARSASREERGTEEPFCPECVHCALQPARPTEETSQ